MKRTIIDLIGNTPLVRLPKINDTSADLVGKLEFYNPMASVKDRIGLAMVEAAEREGKLRPGDEIIMDRTAHPWHFETGGPAALSAPFTIYAGEDYTADLPLALRSPRQFVAHFTALMPLTPIFAAL